MSSSFKPLLLKAATQTDLFTAEDASAAFKALFETSDVSPAQIGAFLTTLYLNKLERTPRVLGAAASVLRENWVKVDIGVQGGDEKSLVVDIVGTGGDGHNTFNVSTTAAIVAAGAGARVVKHGGRASTSASGSADLLESLGCNLSPQPSPLSPIPFHFLLASHYHPAMAALAPIRKSLPFRTILNLLGPLLNPAEPKAMILGVSSQDLGPVFIETLKSKGLKRAMVVCGMEGLDEISCAGGTSVWSLDESGQITTSTLHPSDFGLEPHPLSAVAGGNPAENSATLVELLTLGDELKTKEKLLPIRDFVVMNAAALLVVAGVAKDYKEGAVLALESITKGNAWKALERFREAGKQGGA